MLNRRSRFIGRFLLHDLGDGGRFIWDDRLNRLHLTSISGPSLRDHGGLPKRSIWDLISNVRPLGYGVRQVWLLWRDASLGRPLKCQTRNALACRILDLVFAPLDILQVVDHDTSEARSNCDRAPIDAKCDLCQVLTFGQSDLLIWARICWAILIYVNLLDLFALCNIVKVHLAVVATWREKEVVYLGKSNAWASFSIMRWEHELFASLAHIDAILRTLRPCKDTLGIPNDDVAIFVWRGEYMPLDYGEPHHGDLRFFSCSHGVG